MTTTPPPGGAIEPRESGCGYCGYVHHDFEPCGPDRPSPPVPAAEDDADRYQRAMSGYAKYRAAVRRAERAEQQVADMRAGIERLANAAAGRRSPALDGDTISGFVTEEELRDLLAPTTARTSREGRSDER